MVKINANGKEITLLANNTDYVSLTDIAKYLDPENPRFIIQNWMRNRNTIEFLGAWETINNTNFNRLEFDTVRNASGTNALIKNGWRN